MFGPDPQNCGWRSDLDPDVKKRPPAAIVPAGRRPAGLKGGTGLAEDTSGTRPSPASRLGPVELSDTLKAAKRRATLYSRKPDLAGVQKKLQVVRFYDAKRNTGLSGLLEDKVVEGSPNHQRD